MFLQIKAAIEFIRANITVILYAVMFSLGWYFCSLSYKADIEKERADAATAASILQTELSDVQAKYDDVKSNVRVEQITTKVYVDRWKVLKECRVTNAFKEIHDASVERTTRNPERDFVDSYSDITCEHAARIIRWNYLEVSKKDAQIAGLQAVVTNMKQAFERVGK